MWIRILIFFREKFDQLFCYLRQGIDDDYDGDLNIHPKIDFLNLSLKKANKI